MASKGSGTRFQIFRYQILPFESKKQFDIESPIKDVKNIDELRERKNEFFLKVITNIDSFEYPYGEVTHKIIYNSNDRIIMKLGAHKDVELTHKDFSKREYEDWTPITVYIDNRPNRQFILIEKNRKVFSNPRVVTNILQDNLNDRLKDYFLATYIKPCFEENEFWALVATYEERIMNINFELISPNMANISGGLKLDLHKLNADTNTHKTNLELNSDENSHLEINEENEMIHSLVEYSSEGGGDISMFIKGLRKKIHTKNTVKEVEIDEIEIQDATSTELSEILDSIQ